MIKVDDIPMIKAKTSHFVMCSRQRIINFTKALPFLLTTLCSTGITASFVMLLNATMLSISTPPNDFPFKRKKKKMFGWIKWWSEWTTNAIVNELLQTSLRLCLCILQNICKWKKRQTKQKKLEEEKTNKKKKKEKTKDSKLLKQKHYHHHQQSIKKTQSAIDLLEKEAFIWYDIPWKSLKLCCSISTLWLDYFILDLQIHTYYLCIHKTA